MFKTFRISEFETSCSRIVVRSALVLGVLALVAIHARGTNAAQDGSPPLDVAGKWYLSFDSAMGPMIWVAVFEQEGGEFSGTCDIGMGEAPVTDGRIEGNKISFNVQLNMPGHEMTLSFEGTVEGDEATGTLTGMGDEQEWSGSRKS